MKKNYIKPEVDYIEFYSDKAITADSDNINSLGFSVDVTEWVGGTTEGNDSWE